MPRQGGEPQSFRLSLPTRRGAASAWIGAVIVLLAFAAAAPAAPADPIADVEELVRASYYDGFPYDQVTQLEKKQIARLVEMLADPAESESHANIVLALGVSGRRAAFAPLRAYASAPLEGEVDRAAYRARSRVPVAMGHLARSQRRALKWLLAEAGRPEAAPEWSFRHQRGQALGLVLREQVLTGLALSGAPEADAALQREARRGDDRRTRHAEHARALHRVVKTQGARALFNGRPD